MNNRIYEKICKKNGHNWAFKDEETCMVKICLNCKYKQFFFPEEECEHTDLLQQNDNRRNDRYLSEKLWSRNGGFSDADMDADRTEDDQQARNP